MTRSVLVVDDEKNIRTTLADILVDEGYDVSTAENGEKAVRMCQKRAFDVVLMDVRMPGIDGFEAFRRIRAGRGDARVVMMSAYSVHALQREMLDAGAIAVMRKPLDMDQLFQLMLQAPVFPGLSEPHERGD